MGERDIYITKVRCLNCGHVWEEAIGLGILVAEQIKKETITCTNCKCEDARVIPDGRME